MKVRTTVLLAWCLFVRVVLLRNLWQGIWLLRKVRKMYGRSGFVKQNASCAAPRAIMPDLRCRVLGCIYLGLEQGLIRQKFCSPDGDRRIAIKANFLSKLLSQHYVALLVGFTFLTVGRF